jgi:type IV pilus biogenesis protein CpaD/CtpE
LRDVTTFEYKDLQKKFESQKKNRNELATRRFNEIIEETVASPDSIKFIMNKNQIRLFIEEFENAHSVSLITKDPSDSSDEYWASQLFQEYVDQIVEFGLIYDEHKRILNNIFDLEIT